MFDWNRAADALADAPPGRFALWEARAALDAGHDGRRLDFDGGARSEGAGGDAWFVVGAGPAACAAATGAAAAEGPDPDGWRDALAWLDAEARRLAEETRRAVRHFEASLPRSATLADIRLEVRLRLRAWRPIGGAPAVALDAGCRLRGSIESARGRGELDVEAERPDDWASPAAARDARLRAAAGGPEFRRGEAGAELADGPPPRVGATGPLRLDAAAAAWLAHELGHAAIEGALPPGCEGAALIDDPLAAPWPVGFAWDDAGDAARAVALWGDASLAPDARLGRAARRRDSVRSAASPALSATRLVATRPAPLGAGDAPLLRGAAAGRFDPASRTIVLSGGEFAGDDGRLRGAVVVVDAAQAAATLAALEASQRLGGAAATATGTATCAVAPAGAGAATCSVAPTGAGAATCARRAACSRLGARAAVRAEAPAVWIDGARVLLPGARR